MFENYSDHTLFYWFDLFFSLKIYKDVVHPIFNIRTRNQNWNQGANNRASSDTPKNRKPNQEMKRQCSKYKINQTKKKSIEST